MFGAVFCVFAFITCLQGSRRSLGHGAAYVWLWGYLYGFIRARWYDGVSHFVFDAALLGLYAGEFGKYNPLAEHRQSAIRPWLIAQLLWPVVVMTYSPALPGGQTLVGQVAGYHSLVLYLPMLLVGARMRRSDLDTLAPWMAFGNIVVFGFAAYEYVFGVESVLPRNGATELIYMSNDIRVAGESYLRIPGTFTQSHAYGFGMLSSVPLIVHGLESGRRVRLLCIAGLIAGATGMFMAGARSPVVCLAIATAMALTSMRAKFSTYIGVAAVGLMAAYLVVHNERMQRFETVMDTDVLTGRVSGGSTTEIFDIILDYPLGLGLGAAWGTSIPGFLMSMTNPQIGFESEFARIVVDTGFIGLGLWVWFFVWVFLRGDKSEGTLGSKAFFGPILLVSLVGASIGVGALCSVPGTALTFFLVGLRCAEPDRVAAATRGGSRWATQAPPSAARPSFAASIATARGRG